MLFLFWQDMRKVKDNHWTYLASALKCLLPLHYSHCFGEKTTRTARKEPIYLYIFKTILSNLLLLLVSSQNMNRKVSSRSFTSP